MVVKPVVLSNRLYNRFDNRLYRVNGVSVNLSVNTRYCAACVRVLLLYTAHSRNSLIESYEVFLDEAPMKYHHRHLAVRTAVVLCRLQILTH